MQRPSKEQIRLLPLYVGLGLSEIHIVENEQDAQQALAVLSTETSLGFDTETKPIFRKGVVCPGPTLIQLSTPTMAFLFPTRFPAAVSAASVLLSDPLIKKIGFGTNGDVKELRNKLAINMVNTLNLAVALKNLVGEKNQIGARAAVAMVLNARLPKGAQQSNWGAYPLSKNQIYYAANDAHSAICIANTLNLKNR
ncbi:3'-5' exonuclease [Psychromonas sp. Urea-02u-13]|uniref:3'-5' exonuclease n=1 Tax=Psychromonas sp. Urea-02u-13 TaxID=2058326 RepID=UPI000C32AA38|nr:3'-5' exonuclease [Psychromonas sp. Urea-02u-13]PKG37848.1 3'-5' exonuclease domain-containing protein 2 [Psychromonas sp. Urea-02u-13]